MGIILRPGQTLVDAYTKGHGTTHVFSSKHIENRLQIYESRMQ